MLVSHHNPDCVFVCCSAGSCRSAGFRGAEGEDMCVHAGSLPHVWRTLTLQGTHTHTHTHTYKHVCITDLKRIARHFGKYTRSPWYLSHTWIVNMKPEPAANQRQETGKQQGWFCPKVTKSNLKLTNYHAISPLFNPYKETSVKTTIHCFMEVMCQTIPWPGNQQRPPVSYW